jgi:hypothetical protein
MNGSGAKVMLDHALTITRCAPIKTGGCAAAALAHGEFWQAVAYNPLTVFELLPVLLSLSQTSASSALLCHFQAGISPGERNAAAYHL